MPKGIYQHKPLSDEARLKLKGRIAWNKGKKGLQVAWNKGIKIDRQKFSTMGHFLKHSEEAKRKMSESCLKNPSRYWLGKKTSKKHKENLSKAHIGKNIGNNNGFKKGQSPWNKGKKNFILPEKHWNWKGGITPENHKIRMSFEMKYWRKSVFARDIFTCQKCWQVGGKIQAHHINNFADFSELRTSIENGITFCKEHHKEFHKIYGKKNNTKEQLREFLN